MIAPLWTLYNNKTEQSIEGLTPEEAVQSIQKQPASELEFWFVWFEGLASWEPVQKRAEFAAAVESLTEPEEKTVLDFDDKNTTVSEETDPAVHIFWMADSPDDEPLPASLEEISALYQPGQATSGNLPKQGPVETSLSDQAVSMPEAKDKNGSERRQFERFEIRYRVIVRNENLTFRTFSKNISLGGVALEMTVPEAMLGSDCQIYVGNPKTGENIRFAGKLVPNRSDAKYFLFLKSSAESLAKLQKWIGSHSPMKMKTA